MLAETTSASALVIDVAADALPSWLLAAGWVCIVWYVIVTVVCLLGWTQLHRHYSNPPRKSVSASSLPASQVPHVTIIRPIKGVEPYLYECLASTLCQEYPKDKLTVYFCIETTQDPSFPTLKQLQDDFPDADVRIFVEEKEGYDEALGPNPKIRNMSRAYRDMKGDIVWIADCNVWVSKGVCGRMVDRLCGFENKKGIAKKYKFVHHLPIVVSVDGGHGVKDEAARGLLERWDDDSEMEVTSQAEISGLEYCLSKGGSRLEELFLSSSHAKMYSAINTVLIAPCIIGKSTMFRKSHLDYLTPTSTSPSHPYPRRPGIDFFSDIICEDHAIGDRLWKGKVREEENGEKWGKHSQVFGDLAIQPVSDMSVSAYIHRRVRWLRVRKFTVFAATFVEPGTESFFCSAQLAFGLTTVLPNQYPQKFAYLSTWSAFLTIWLLSILFWITIDWTTYLRLHSGATVEADEHTPRFARRFPKGKIARRPFVVWLLAWLGRETLALPIWTWAVYGGSRVVWRDREFYVRMDTTVHEVPGSDSGSVSNGLTESREARVPAESSVHERRDLRRRSLSHR